MYNPFDDKEADIWCMKTNNCELIHKDTIELQKLETQHNNLTGSHGEQNEYPFEEYIEHNNISIHYKIPNRFLVLLFIDNIG